MRNASWPLASALAAAVLLGGCSNQVFSDHPLFTAKDSAGLPHFKPGVWWGGPMADCPYDQRLPIEKWPDCAGGLLFGARGLEAEFEKGKVKPFAEAEGVDYVVTAGDPIVIQYISKAPDPASRYYFMAVGPTERDASGDVVAFRMWAVLCGPPPPPSAETGVTAQPWPGLEIKDNNCIARDAAAVRFAAKASGTLETAPTGLPIARWLRSGRR